MAADGSLKFDTKINTDGFDSGISTLKKSMDRLTLAVERLTANIVSGFSGASQAVTETADRAEGTAREVEGIADAAKRAADETADLKKQMDAISVTNTAAEETKPMPERKTTVDNPNLYGYDQEALHFIDQYAQGVQDADTQTNEFKKLLSELQGQLKSMEKQGMYFGDEKYDETYLQLSKIKQALADYKKEITSPTPDAVVFPADSLQGKVERLKKEVAELSAQGKTFGDTLYDSTYQALNKAQAELTAYKKELSAPVNVQLQLDPNSFTGQINQLKQQLSELSGQGITMGMPEYDQVYMKLQKVITAQKQYEAYLKNLAQLSNQSGAAIAGEGDKAGMTAEQMDKLAREKAQASSENKKLGDKAEQTSAKLNKEGKGAKWLSSMLGMASKTISRLGKGFTQTGKQADKGSRGMLSMLKRMVLFSMVHKIISGIGKAFKEGIQNYAGYSSSFNAIMTSFVGSLTQLKNSFAAAFSPLTSIAIPALDALIQKLIQAINVIGQFLAALTGKGTFTKAVKVNQDYAAGLKKTGGAAKQAGKDAKKALAPFDDLVQIQRQGADASGGGGGGIDPSQMFTEEAIGGEISDFAKKLRELFEAGDWEGIGKLIGEKINEAVQSFTDFISWDNLGDRITAFVTAFTTMFNSLVATIDWEAIGIMMGTGINTLAYTLYLLLTQIDWFMLGNALSQSLMGMVHTVNWAAVGATIGAYFQAQISGLLGFIIGADWGTIGAAFATCLMGITTQINWEQFGFLLAAGLNGAFALLLQFAATYDWEAFGNQIATSLSTFFQTFQWSQAGEALSTFVIGILDFLITVVQETDWGSFVQGIVDCITAIDWIGLAGRIYTLFYSALGVAFGALARFVGELIANGFAAAKEYFQGKIEECGGNVWEGLLKGIVDAAKGVASWIMNNVVTPFLNGVKAGFGINGPSAKMAEMGQFLWDGFCNGVKALFQSPIPFIQKNITEPFINGIKSLLGIHSPSTVMAEMGQYLWDGFCNGIKEFFSNPGAFIKANITDPFVNGVKGLLGIHSPSTVLAGIGSNTVAGFNQGVTNEQAASQSVVQSWASGVASWFANKFGISSGDSTEARQWAMSILSGFNNSVSKNYTKSQAVMQTWAENVRKWFVGVDEAQGVNELSWTKFADLIIQAFKVKIEGSHAETQEPMESWARNVREWFWGDGDTQGTGGMYAAFYNMAKRINEGFANGISDFAYMAKAAIRKWAREAMEAAEEEFDINSPSKEFYGIAEYVVRGFNDGISTMAATSRNTVQKWLDGVLDVFDGVEVQLPIGINIPNAASYLPRMASGTVVPPRAGEMSTSMRTMAGYGLEETLSGLIAEMNERISRLESEGNRPIQIVLNLTGNLAALARVLKPELDKEATRKGVSLVIVGG